MLQLHTFSVTWKISAQQPYEDFFNPSLLLLSCPRRNSSSTSVAGLLWGLNEKTHEKNKNDVLQ